MMPDDHDHAGPDQESNLPGWAWGTAALLFLAIATLYAFSTSFSYFAAYDDEGFLMISVRGYLEGHPLYDGILTYYGPFYYFYEWLLHAVVSLPLTHEFTRGICLFHWLAAASVLALAAGRMTRSVLLAFFVFMLATMHLTPLAREPGHPQELVALLLPLAVLVAERGWQRKWTPALLGAIGAALVFTKINVGVFFGFALLLAWSSQAPWFQSRPAWFWGLLAMSALAVPCLLMRSHLDETWARIYCAQAGVAILAAGAFARSWRGERRAGFAWLFQAGAGLTGLSAFFIAVLLFTGTSLPAMVENLVTGPAKLGNAFYVALKVPHCSWSGAAALLAAAAVMGWRARLDRFPFAIAAAKCLYGLLGTLLLLNDYNRQLGYLLPWCWLLLVRTQADCPWEGRYAFARAFLCLQAAWQGLQAYPTAGTQAVIATLLPLLIYSLCLHDGIMVFATAPGVVSRLRNLTPRTAGLLKALVLVGLLYVFAVNWCKPLSSWRYYASVPPLGLPGARHLRLPNEQVTTYRALAQYLETECDTFITIPGLNSLYFWTGKTPPTYFNVSEVVLLNDDQQTRVVAALEKARHPLIVVKEGGAYPFSVGAGPLGRLVDRRCREIRRIGRFRILELQGAGVE